MDELKDATQLEKYLLCQAAAKRQPINGSIELTPLCNMDCRMCYVRLSPAEQAARGRLRTLDQWLDLARQMQKAGVLFLLLTGGEPLLWPDFKALYLELKKLGMVLTVNTNGTLIDEEWADFFGAHRPRRVNVTLYGASRDAYAALCRYPDGFERTLRGVRLLRERGVDVKVGSSLTRLNRADGERIAALAREMGAAVHTDTYMLSVTRERNTPYDASVRLEPEDAGQMYARLLKTEYEPEAFRRMAQDTLYLATHTPPGERAPGCMRCQAGRGSFTINWQGEMRPCVTLPSPSIPVFELGFDAAWKSLVEQTEQIRLSPKCNVCTLRQVCDTCAAAALCETGAYDGTPDYLCRYTKAKLEALAQELAAFQTEGEPHEKTV